MSDNRPRCPECGDDMILRTAKKGPRYGQRFWGCRQYPSCRGTATFNGAEEDPVNPPTKPPYAPQPEMITTNDSYQTNGIQARDLRKQRVDWPDGSFGFESDGWQVGYATVGASLRSVRVEGIDSLSNCWIASTSPLRGFEPDRNTRRALDVMGKLLRRGLTPPLHPDSERVLIESVGLGDRIRPSPQPGDVSFNLHNPYTVGLHDLTVTPGGHHVEIEPSLAESDEERLLMEWMAEHHPRAVRWLIPQASFDDLLQAAGHKSAGYRRCDFLWGPPGNRPFVIEIDGTQHETQQLTDRERDLLLRDIGIETIRVSTSEIRIGHGPQLEAVANAIEATVEQATNPSDEDKLLVWVPIQVHRLALGLCEAIHRGFLSGDSWLVQVEDPTHMAIELIAPYLEMLYALCSLWDARSVAPERVLFKDGEEKVLFHRNQEGQYKRRDASEESGSVTRVRILLQCDRTSCQPLPDRDGAPTVVIRSTGVPVLMSDPPGSDSNRIAVRIEGDEGRDPLKILLRAVFAKDDFRDGQYEAIVEVMSMRDCAVLLPTGAGKSLIYQLAGLCLPGRTLVIDPLVALINDQVAGLRRHGIDRVQDITGYIQEPDRVAARIANAEAYFVFVTPERFQISKFRQTLARLTSFTLINLAVIDEAHCVSEWGHNFRYAYLNLGRSLRMRCKDQSGQSPPLLALTGTASRAVLSDVLFQLSITEHNDNSIVQPESFDRPELNYHIGCISPDHPATLQGELRRLPSLFNIAPARFFMPRGEQTFSGLVFVPTVDQRPGGLPGLMSTRDAVAEICPSVGVYAGSNPRNIPSREFMELRRVSVGRFMDNEIIALVCTSAFGMGIDKPNIRWIIHYLLPRSIESYYQEVGRAGRDGNTAECTLIISEFDKDRNQNLLSEYTPLEDIRNRLNRIASRARDDVTTALWFHLGNFPGMDDEISVLMRVAHELNPRRERQEINLPFNGREAGARERALHRLAILGVVDDYLKERGAQTFVVTVNNVNTERIINSLLAFIERSQPGQMTAIRNAVGHPDDLMSSIRNCGEELIKFVYRTIEMARRRSLREMRLAAHSAVESNDPNREMRQQILDYLQEGFATQVLLSLVEESDLNFSNWILEWNIIETETIAREWRGATGRLLVSYPDYPWLLATRAVTEAMIPDGNSREFENGLMESLQSARVLYQIPQDAISEAVSLIIAFLGWETKWAASLFGVAHYSETPPAVTDEEMRTYSEHNWPLAVFSLAEGVEFAETSPSLHWRPTEVSKHGTR